jgi:hypothetical protein
MQQQQQQSMTQPSRAGVSGADVLPQDGQIVAASINVTRGYSPWWRASDPAAAAPI